MKDDTLAVIAGRDPLAHGGTVSPPIDRSSTRIFADLTAIETAHSTGRLSDFLGSRTPDMAELAIAALEGSGCEVVLTSSGMSALTVTFLAMLRQGDHLLMPDSVFGPTRAVAGDLLARMGIESSYYHPLAQESELRSAMRPNTRLVLTESPGSNTFEVQDIPMICRVAHAGGALVAIDNSWATPVFFKPLAHGVDLSISAATKYLAGHSDIIIGSIAAAPELAKRLRSTLQQLGDSCSPDDAWLLMRGLRTLPLRLRQHDASARRIAAELASWPGVRRVLHPALADCDGHAFWQRDFTGASGLFGVLVDPLDRQQLDAFLGAMQLFKLGYSWGGFESLILPLPRDPARTLLGSPDGTLLRLHVGLEDADDLLADLKAAFATLRKSNS